MLRKVYLGKRIQFGYFRNIQATWGFSIQKQLEHYCNLSHHLNSIHETVFCFYFPNFFSNVSTLWKTQDRLDNSHKLKTSWKTALQSYCSRSINGSFQQCHTLPRFIRKEESGGICSFEGPRGHCLIHCISVDTPGRVLPTGPISRSFCGAPDVGIARGPCKPWLNIPWGSYSYGYPAV